MTHRVCHPDWTPYCVLLVCCWSYDNVCYIPNVVWRSFITENSMISDLCYQQHLKDTEMQFVEDDVIVSPEHQCMNNILSLQSQTKHSWVRIKRCVLSGRVCAQVRAWITGWQSKGAEKCEKNDSDLLPARRKNREDHLTGSAKMADVYRVIKIGVLKKALNNRMRKHCR